MSDFIKGMLLASAIAIGVITLLGMATLQFADRFQIHEQD